MFKCLNVQIYIIYKISYALVTSKYVYIYLWKLIVSDNKCLAVSLIFFICNFYIL